MPMTSLFPIVSRLCHLTVKTLHHYHDVGLLEPARVDESSGYRQYEAAQLGRARIIRRLRALDMPIDEVGQVLEAQDQEAQELAISAHLERMELELQRTQDVVASLRSLLTRTLAPIDVSYRTIPQTLSVAITENVNRPDTAAWCNELAEVVEAKNLEPTGSSGGIYPSDFLTEGTAQIVAFVPVVSAVTVGRVSSLVVPEGTFAVAIHTGPYLDLDCCYGPLGAFVAEQAASTDTTQSTLAPFREYYLDAPSGAEDQSAFRTEVCWPVSG